jgi:hypothetical protein
MYQEQSDEILHHEKKYKDLLEENDEVLAKYNQNKLQL